MKEGVDAWQAGFEPCPVSREKNEVIGIANVALRLKLVLCKLIELVHVDVDEELAREIAKREAFVWGGGVETRNDSANKPEDVLVRNV